jgi:hypothetical protein
LVDRIKKENIIYSKIYVAYGKRPLAIKKPGALTASCGLPFVWEKQSVVE